MGASQREGSVHGRSCRKWLSTRHGRSETTVTTATDETTRIILLGVTPGVNPARLCSFDHPFLTHVPVFWTIYSRCSVLSHSTPPPPPPLPSPCTASPSPRFPPLSMYLLLPPLPTRVSLHGMTCGTRVLKSESFLELRWQQVLNLVREGELQVDEAELFKAVQAWVSRDTAERRRHVDEASCVRHAQWSAQVLCCAVLQKCARGRESSSPLVAQGVPAVAPPSVHQQTLSPPARLLRCTGGGGAAGVLRGS